METKLRIHAIRLLNKIKQNQTYKNYVEIDVKPRETLVKGKTKD